LEGLSPSRAGTYSVIIENSEGFVKREADLTVQVPPSIISGPGPESRFVAAGSEVVYSVSVGGDPLPSIQWLRNGEPLEGRTLSTLALPSVTVIDEGVYSVRLTNAAGSIESNGSELKVGSGARIISSPRSKIGAIGESVTFTVVADGNPLPAFQWFRNGNALPESYGSDSSLTLSNLSSADAGIYTVQVYNQFGTVTSESAELRVAQPVSVTRPNQVQTFAPGSTLVFGSPGNPSNPLRYEWYRDGKRLGGANASQLSLASASFSDSGVYSVKIFNSKGKLVASRVVARVAVSVANVFDVLLRDRTSGDPAGIVRLDIARAGAFTGRLQLLDGSVHSIRGALKFTDQFTSGQATVNVRRKGAASLTLVLDLDPHSAQFGCALGEGELIIATGSAERRFTGTANWAGFYTLTLSASGSSSSILDATVAKSGVLRLSGSLTDGSRVTFFGPASIAASYPILMLPYRKGTGYLVGELGLVSSADGYFADEESSDLWIWRRPSNGSPLVGALSPMLTP
jgi:hypothetical protein